MKTKKIFWVILFLFIIKTPLLFAYPTTEKEPASASAPLELLSAQPIRIFVPQFGTNQNRFLFSIADSSSTLNIIDLETWDLFETQPDIFSATVADVALLPDGETLIIGLTSGNIAELDLSDTSSFENTEAVTEETTTDEDEDEDEEEILDSRQTDLAENMTAAGISFMVADPDDDIIYMVNASGYFFQYNFNTNIISEMQLLDITGSTTTDTEEETETTTTTTTNTYTPTDMVFAQADNGNKILVATTTGDIISITPGESLYSVKTLNSSHEAFDILNPNLCDMALTPDNNFLYVVDDDNDLIWVYSLASEKFIDQQSSGTSLDPIEVDPDDNESFSHVLVHEDASNNIVAYVSGNTGLTLIDADNPGTASAQSKVIDRDEADSENDEDPITLTGTPGPLAETAGDVEYIFSANANADISILTDNPWITVSALSPDTVNATTSSFTVTFQSDAAGTYSIYVNSNPEVSSGTELITDTAFTDLDTDITTAAIDINNYSRSVFAEGSNKIFVFVTDDSDRVGHSALVLDVDRPPEPTTITGVNFGNKKAYINFRPSSDEDIKHYGIYAEPAANQANPSCPGSLTFDSDNTKTSRFNHSSCGENLCEASAKNLTNDVAYCLAVKVVDLGGQSSTLSAYTVAVTPEQTVGPAGFLGETSCALHTGSTKIFSVFWFLCFIPFLLLPILRLKQTRFITSRPYQKSRLLFFVVLLVCVVPTMAQARAINSERTPQHWTFEPKISYWIPTDSNVKNFIGNFPHFAGEFEFGWLFKNRYNITASTGFGYESGNAVGSRSGGASGDDFSLFLFPLRLDFVYRFDFKTDQLFLPYVRSGLDLVLFHESDPGYSITNFKYGVHAGAGIGLLLDRIEQLGHDLETNMGVNDIYLTLDIRYAFLSSFKSTGLDLSGIYPHIGLLFEF